jgi:hypothetical protein
MTPSYPPGLAAPCVSRVRSCSTPSARFARSTARTFFQWLCLALLALFVGLGLSACGGGGDSGSGAATATATGGGNAAARAKWTYLVYVSADNTLSEMATFNLNQMKAANSSNDVRVVVQMEQSRQYTPNAPNATQRGLVIHGEAQLASMGRNVNMADKQSLSEFIKWGKATYPADHYGVVIWSHGGGWKADKDSRGALQDLSSGAGLMSVKDIAWALEDAGGVDLLNFDACLMAMYEVAFELRHAAKVMVAAEEAIPGQGNPYDAVIDRMVANPGQDATALANGIVDDFNNFYKPPNRDPITISAIDLSRIDALDVKVRESAALLITSLTSERMAIETARINSPHYTYPNNHDLIAFATDLAGRTTTPALRTKLTELAAVARAAVLSSRATANSPVANSTAWPSTCLRPSTPPPPSSTATEPSCPATWPPVAAKPGTTSSIRWSPAAAPPWPRPPKAPSLTTSPGTIQMSTWTCW